MLITSVACLTTGAVCGLVNGLGVIGLGLHPFIITLGTMSIFRGIAFVTTKAQSIGNLLRAWISSGRLCGWQDCGSHAFVDFASNIRIFSDGVGGVVVE